VIASILACLVHPQLSAYQAQVTGALWGGLIPAGLLGWLGSWLRLRYFLKTVAGRFE
jgi:hypothetical protein